ncbi:MAG: reverse transcriptase family protein [Acidobacteriota bacterium]
MGTEPFTIKRLNIAHEKSLALHLGCNVDELQQLAESAKSFYKPFELIPKLRPFAKKPPKKPRQIDNPAGKLKEIQDRINKALLEPILMPEHVFGAVKHRSILGNAQRHQGAPVLVSLDIRQCFPSVTNAHIYGVWTTVLGCSPSVASLLTKLTTFKRHLPQGAPTSPALANIFIWSVDGPIREKCADLGVEYSTWIDDLAFSGDNAREIIQIAVEALRVNGLRISHKKTQIMGGCETKTLTGTRLGRRSLRAPKKICDRARAGIHNLERGLVAEHERDVYCRKLSALIMHIRRISPKDSVGLENRLSALVQA